MSGHVAIFVPSLGKAGGVERVAVNLATGLDERGRDVEIVTSQPDGPFADDLPRGVPVTGISGARLPLVGVAAAIPGLVAYLRRRQPGTLLSAMNHVNVPAIVAHGIANSDARLIVSEHNNPTLLTSQRNPHARKDRAVYTAARYLYDRADSVVAVSEGVADDLAEVVGYPRDEVEVVYNPVVSDRLLQAAAEPVDHPWFDGDVPVVLAAKPEAQKNLSLLVRAFDRVREAIDCRLLIVGEGERRDALESLARRLDVADSVALSGYVENIYAHMARSSVFALSSNWEGLPTVLIEAMACGCPVVSTDCPSGPAEILGGGEYGELVPVGDAEALARAIRDVIIDPPDERPLERRADDFSVETATAAYQRIIG